MKARTAALALFCGTLLPAQDLPERVRDLTRQGQTLAVEQLFRAQLTEHPRDVVLREGLVSHYLRQQQFIKAAAAQNELIASLDKDDPQLRPALISAAGIQEQMNDFAGAEALFRRADALPLPMATGPVLRPSELGDFYARHRRWPQAETVYRELARRDDLTGPMRIATLHNLATALANQHREAEALTVEQEVSKLSETSDDPHARRLATQAREAMARLSATADPDAARRYYEAELQRTSALTGPSRSQYAQTLISYVLLLERQSDFDGAEKLLRQYLAEAQAQGEAGGPFKPTTAYAFLANLEYQRGNMDAGHNWRAQDPSYRPPDAIPPAQLESVSTAQRLFEQGNTEEAITQLDQALAALPNAGRDSLYRLGQVTALIMTLRQSGQTEAADNALTRAVAALERLYGPDSPQAMELELDYCQQFCPDRGLKLVDRARLADAQRHGAEHPSQVDWIERKILFLKQANRPEEIEAEYDDIIRLSSAIYGPHHDRTLG